MLTILEDTGLLLNVFRATIAVLCRNVNAINSSVIFGQTQDSLTLTMYSMRCMEKDGGLCSPYVGCSSKRLLESGVCHHYLLCCTSVILSLVSWSGYLHMCSSRRDFLSSIV